MSMIYSNIMAKKIAVQNRGGYLLESIRYSGGLCIILIHFLFQSNGNDERNCNGDGLAQEFICSFAIAHNKHPACSADIVA